jgi:uncharacterized protein
MNPLLHREFEAKRSALAALCETHGVKSLDLFGSGATDDWNPNESDLDFVVSFRPEPGPGIADRYLGLAEDLEKLFGRPVDLLTSGGIRNPYLRRSIDATRARVYAK